MMSLRFAPIATLLLFFLVGAVGRSFVQRRRHGSFGFALTRRQAPWAVVLPGAVAAHAVLAASHPETLAPWTLPLPEAAQLLGVAIMVIATPLTAAAQLDLGPSWRIGIEQDARPGL